MKIPRLIQVHPKPSKSLAFRAARLQDWDESSTSYGDDTGTMMRTAPTLLMVSAGFRPELLATPMEMGFRVAVVDVAPPRDPSVYDDFIPAQPTDDQAVLEAVEEYVSRGARIDAVGCFFDGSIYAAAAVAEKFGLPGNSREAVRNMRDKYRSWQVLSGAGLPVPATELAPTVDDAVTAARRIGFPVVLKPQASAASQGVIKAGDEDELRAAFDVITSMYQVHAFGTGETATPNIGQQLYLPQARGVLIQQYVSGFEICVDLVYSNGRCELLAILDKPQVWPEPYFPELMFVTPSSLPASAQETVRDLSAQALRAVGASAGAAHIEFRVTAAGDPAIIEVNGRVGGPSLFVQEIIQLATGRWGPGEYIAAIAPAAAPPAPAGTGATHGSAGFASLPVDRCGRIARFEGVDEVMALPGVADIRWVMRPGQYVAEGFPRNPSVMFAHVLAVGDSYANVVTTLERVRGTLKAVIED